MIAIGVVACASTPAIAGRYRPLVDPRLRRSVAALVVAAHFGTAFNVLYVLAASFPLLFAFAARRRHTATAPPSRSG